MIHVQSAPARFVEDSSAISWRRASFQLSLAASRLVTAVWAWRADEGMRVAAPLRLRKDYLYSIQCITCSLPCFLWSPTLQTDSDWLLNTGAKILATLATESSIRRVFRASTFKRT